MLRGVTYRGLGTVALVAWLAYADYRILVDIVLPFDALGGDGLLYSRAAAAWLSGGDPYMVTTNGTVFVAAPPPTLLPFALTAWMPDELARWTWIVAGFAAIAMTVRVARLPWWCLLFPPSFYSAAHGSVETVMVLCLVGPAFLAPVLKVYATVPLVVLGRWRDLAIAGVLLVVTAPFLPWSAFLAHLPEIGPRLAEQQTGGYSAWGQPLLMVLVLLSLPVLGRRVAAFAIVPTLWPSLAPQYGAMLLPVLDRVPLAALTSVAILARGGVAIGVVAQAGATAVGRVWRKDLRPQPLKLK